MRKTLRCFLFVMVLLSGFTVSNLFAVDVNLNDPQDILNKIKLDYHPDYGVVQKGDML
jgi:hypothetical protein